MLAPRRGRSRPSLSSTRRSWASTSSTKPEPVSWPSTKAPALPSAGSPSASGRPSAVVIERKKPKMCSRASGTSRAPRTISCSVAEATYFARRGSSACHPSRSIAPRRMARRRSSVVCHAAASASWAALRSSVLAPSDRSSSRGRRQYSAGTALSSRRYQPFAPSGRSSRASSGRSSSGTTARISSSSSASTRAGSGRQPYRSPSRTRKFGLGVTRWQRAISSRQIAIARWSRPASSLTPQRRSIAWKRAPRAAQSSSSRGKTCAWSRPRSSLKSSKVELTKTRNVRLTWRGSPVIA